MSLRLLQIVVAAEAADEVRSIVETDAGVTAWLDPLQDGLVLIRALLIAESVEGVTDRLETQVMPRDEMQIMLLPVEAAIPRLEPASSSPAVRTDTRISREELYGAISGATRSVPVFLTMSILSAVVASIGLLRDNVAVLIAAMVIAPLLGPNMALALATTLGDGGLARRAIFINLIGSISVLAVAVLIGVLFTVDPTGPEIAARTGIGAGDLLLALCAGVAGTLAFTTGASSTLIGVMVAVALVPPLVAFGMLLGTGAYQPALGAALMLAANIICVNIAAVATFMVLGVRPAAYWEAQRARRATRLAFSAWVLLLIALFAIVYFGSD